MKISLACDHGALRLKEAVHAHLFSEVRQFPCKHIYRLRMELNDKLEESK